MKTNTGNVRYFNVFLNFVEKVMEEGRNVLIHCVAGEHRARTAACAWLLYAHNLSMDDAIKLANSRRDANEPIFSLPELFRFFRIGLDEEGLLDQIRSSVNVQEDTLAILKAETSG